MGAARSPPAAAAPCRIIRTMVITGRGSHEIADSVERAVVAGELDPGSVLPPIRELAGELGVNPNTVASAYRLLRDRGLVETGGRRGTRVRAQSADAPRELDPGAVPPGARDVAGGNPDVRLLPDLGGALATVAARRAGRHPLYGAPPVVPECWRPRAPSSPPTACRPTP